MSSFKDYKILEVSFENFKFIFPLYKYLNWKISLQPPNCWWLCTSNGIKKPVKKSPHLLYDISVKIYIICGRKKLFDWLRILKRSWEIWRFEWIQSMIIQSICIACCIQLVCAHLPYACQQRSIAVGLVGFLLFLLSWPWRFRWCHLDQLPIR